jgi:RecA-family ATPase
MTAALAHDPFATELARLGPLELEPAYRAEDRPSPRRFLLETLATIRPVLDGEWLIKGLMPSRGLMAVYGPPGSAKTFLVQDAVLHVAAGLRWCGRKVRKVGVVYVAAEGGTGARKRIAAAQAERGIPASADFALVTAAPNLGAQDGDAEILISDIRAQLAELGWPPGILVLDTLARTIPGADESSSRDMGIFIQNADRIGRALGCLVIAVHHSGKAVERGMRGSSA